MADIKINDISFDGNDLFADTENFLDDLSNDDMNLIQGGLQAADFNSAFSIVCGNKTAIAANAPDEGRKIMTDE